MFLKVTHPYSPSECDELELRTGDYVYISSEALATSPDGWVEGTSWLTGSSGLLPESYTERTAESDAWTLHKKVALNNTSDYMKRLHASKLTDLGPNNVNEESAPELPSRESISYSSNKAAEVTKDNTYENISDLKPELDKKVIYYFEQLHITDFNFFQNMPQKLFLMRHGERLDFTFGSWVKYCFDKNDKYIRKDLNMPPSLPERKSGSEGFIKDSPLTNVGVLQATLVGEALKEKNVTMDYVYCSPSLRSVQTCAAVLKGLGQRQVKICIEPGLFEWLGWYLDGVPDWLSLEELENFGFNINKDYEPLLTTSQLLEMTEDIKQFYTRNTEITKTVLGKHETGNILFVGHACTLEVCSREILNGSPRNLQEFSKIVSKIPYCGLAVLEEINGQWQLTDPPCPPLTHTNNNRFDWKLMIQ